MTPPEFRECPQGGTTLADVFAGFCPGVSLTSPNARRAVPTNLSCWM